ncbi:uncharacterized protein E0L32_007128 [Thyridium curvatum]|uniref:Uncharacterized protein n=1 Tax=Thyridium curvatum TaxID=1093900 RepID=A0A507AQI2_9PEZI|nr:uncharacterized protein E0L32_007128 [Thyridium curvatum]TPX12242.1 hypothetical protein E0L32_007128 [Thyridium curvatum]
MESQVTRLVDKAWNKLLETPPDRRYMIAIGGIPGSGKSWLVLLFSCTHRKTNSLALFPPHQKGKTTLAKTVVDALNARHATLDPSHPAHATTPIAAFVPMDGFRTLISSSISPFFHPPSTPPDQTRPDLTPTLPSHPIDLTRAQLSAMPDPETAHARRGAEFTFDGAAYLSLIQALSTTTTTTATTVRAPSFDHAVKDPVPDDIAVEPWHRAVVLEGNYLCLDREPWRAAAALADERWFVEVGRDVARARLAARHVRAGIVATLEDGLRRADENDLPNGDEILQNRIPVDEVITSREDGSWVHE